MEQTVTLNKKKTAYYSLTIKRQVLKRILSNELSVAEASREYDIGGSMTIYRWLSRKDELLLADSTGTIMEGIPDQKSKEELSAELATVRRLLEQERLRSEAYLAMIKLAEEKYQIPIEKKSGAKQ